MKQCIDCGAVSERKRCSECKRLHKLKIHKAWRDANREHVRTYSKESMRRYRENQPPEKMTRLATRQRAYNARRYQMVLDHYGAKCACCGEREPKFLSIDHINNDGYQRRKDGDHGSGQRLVGYIIRESYPDDFQILCMNCNHGKSRNGGVCPHKSLKV